MTGLLFKATPGRMLTGPQMRCPVALGGATETIGVATAVNAPPAGAGFQDARVTLSVLTPSGSLIAFLTGAEATTLALCLADAAELLAERPAVVQ